MIKKSLIYLALLYKYLLSPLSPPSCRFTPSCSSYFIQSLEYHGLIKGLALSIVRVLRCHPLHPGGYDPVKRKQ